MEALRLLRQKQRRDFTGVPTSTWYELEKRGLAPPPVRLSVGRVAWVYGELAALNAARIASKTDDEIRVLVAELVAARRGAAK